MNTLLLILLSLLLLFIIGIKIIKGNYTIDLLKTYNYNNKIRLGSINDGGYVIANIDGYDCYISAGVSDEESFSRDFINKFKTDKKNNFAFDGTIEDYPWQYTKDINFIKKNIGGVETDKITDLKNILSQYKNIFLKMDIEGGEYPWLSTIDESLLKNIKQIVIELHGINDDSWNASYADKLNCIKKLTSNHYIIHVHGNNYSSSQKNIPDVIELTLLNKYLFSNEPSLNKTKLPIQNLDYPNNPSINDFDLSFYPFTN